MYPFLICLVLIFKKWGEMKRRDEFCLRNKFFFSNLCVLIVSFSHPTIVHILYQSYLAQIPILRANNLAYIFDKSVINFQKWFLKTRNSVDKNLQHPWRHYSIESKFECCLVEQLDACTVLVLKRCKSLYTCHS